MKTLKGWITSDVSKNNFTRNKLSSKPFFKIIYSFSADNNILIGGRRKVKFKPVAKIRMDLFYRW
jgi:hypothetical protein